MGWPGPEVRWPVIGIAALAAAAALAPAVPMYDGIGNPDEPYRYVTPPVGYRHTTAPDSARALVQVRNGQSQSVLISTAESGPQLSLQLPVGALATDGADRLTVTATPISPTVDPRPTDGTIITNVYRIAASAAGSSVDVIGVGDEQPVLDMRAPTAAQPGPVFERLSGGQWVRSRTTRVGNDVYETVAPALGDWALVRLDRSNSGAATGGDPVAWVAGGIGAAGIVLLVVAVVRRRRLGAKPGQLTVD